MTHNRSHPSPVHIIPRDDGGIIIYRPNTEHSMALSPWQAEDLEQQLAALRKAREKEER